MASMAKDSRNGKPPVARPRRVATKNRIRVVSAPTVRYPATVVCVETDRTCDYYAISPIPSDQGEAFRFRKLTVGDRQIHDCCVENDQDQWCDCLGFEKTGYCRHLQAVRQARQEGALPGLGQWPDQQPAARLGADVACCDPPETELCEACRGDYEGWLREVEAQRSMPEEVCGRQFEDGPLPNDCPF